MTWLALHHRAIPPQPRSGAEEINTPSRHRRNTVDKNRSLAAIVVIIASTVFAVCAWAQTSSPTQPKEQCSLAVVSRLLASSTPVCDGEVVRKMAHSGHVFEQNQVGISCLLAIGPDYTEKEALAWFQQAAQRGYAPAEVNLAVVYINAWGTPVNYAIALHWLHAAASQGFARAYFNLGLLYLEGKGVRQDNAEAFRWFQRGARQDDSSAQTNLGYMYDLGLGVARNAATAADWYRKGAEAGNPLAENNLADIYLRGEGVVQNDASAFSWFQKAAAQGHTGARIKLGYLYANGRGTPKDPEAAYSWLTAAEMAGDPRGKDLLHALEKNLTAEQKARAIQRATNLRQSEPRLTASMFAQ
jgi:hypothetical protein